MNEDQIKAMFPNASGAFLRANASDAMPAPRPGSVRALAATQQPAPRIRQAKGDGMNNTERAFLAYLKAEYPNAEHYSQAFSIRIGNGAAFRPDFISSWTLQPASECGSEVVRLTAWETKGHMREAAAVRIKVAASLFPWIAFKLVTKRTKKSGGGWTIESVLP